MTSVNDADWKAELRQQIEEVARRNSDHKKYSQVQDRTQEMDDIVVKLRELINSRPSEAVQLHRQALSILDETDRLIATTIPKSLASHLRKSLIVTNDLSEHQSGYWRNYNRIMPEKTNTTMRFTTFADFDTIEDVPEDAKSEDVGDEWNQTEEDISEIQHIKDNLKNKRDFKSNLFYSATNKEANSKLENDVRDLWKTQIEFFLSVVGFTVGVGNTIKFPSLAYQHGGGVYFIPYFICLAFFGLPIVFMHLCIGQYSGLSANGAFWKMMPIASGIGWALVLLAVPISIYYNIIVAWSIHYFWFSFRGFFADEPSWNGCHSDWPKDIPCCSLTGPLECFSQPRAISSSEAYFHYQVLNRSLELFLEPEIGKTLSNGISSLDNTTLESTVDIMFDPSLGPIQSHLVLALAAAWIMVFFGVFKGIGSIGWAVTITATLPYLLLGVLLLRGISLPGAKKGLSFLFKPKFENLWSLPMWKAAAEQVFYSLGIDAGPLISMASFSRYRNNIYRDAVAVVLINTFTSVLAGMVIFSFIGFLAQSQNLQINDILRQDSLYIAFTVYPGITSFMDSMGPMWAALFFAMLTLSALDAEFAWIEMIISSVMKQIGAVNQKTEKRFVVGLCFLFFLCGLPLTTRGGIFIFHAIENLNANWNAFSLALVQIFVVCYIYGVDNFIEDVGEMLRVPTNLRDELRSKNLSEKQANFWIKLKFFFGPTGGYIRWTWSLFSPCILMFLLVASVFSYERVALEDRLIPVQYELIAFAILVGPLIVIPITGLYTLYIAWKSGLPLKTVIDTSRWRHKYTDTNSNEVKHPENDGHYYWSIVDPISRVASARRPNAIFVDDVGYGNVAELINKWTANNTDLIAENFISTEGKSPTITETGIDFIYKASDKKNLVGYTPSKDDFTLFGPPPSIGFFENSNTVVYRPLKMKNKFYKEDIANFNLGSDIVRIFQERELTKPASLKRSTNLRKSSSIGDISSRNDCSNSESLRSVCSEYSLKSQKTTKVPDLDFNVNHSFKSTSTVYGGRTEDQRQKRTVRKNEIFKRTALKRPKPIDIPRNRDV